MPRLSNLADRHTASLWRRKQRRHTPRRQGGPGRCAIMAAAATGGRGVMTVEVIFDRGIYLPELDLGWTRSASRKRRQFPTPIPTISPATAGRC